MSPAIVTLTTDFGSGDGYVGAMKGVILAINPDATLVDISHDVPPQDIAHGAFLLGSACAYYPPQTVHLCVVDPTVGASRRGLLLDTPSGRFVGPDNGLFTYVLAGHLRHGPAELVEGTRAGFLEPVTVDVPRGCAAYDLTRTEHWRHPVSDTFHGRDVFAPVAARLSLGTPPEDLGHPLDQVVALKFQPPGRRGEQVEGRVIFVDSFGNLVTNIRSSDIAEGHLEVEIGGVAIGGLSRTYAEAQGMLALIGSRGYLEVAESNGDAAARLSAGVGTRVRATPAGGASRS